MRSQPVVRRPGCRADDGRIVVLCGVLFTAAPSRALDELMDYRRARCSW
jgi:hypothetical protein